MSQKVAVLSHVKEKNDSLIFLFFVFFRWSFVLVAQSGAISAHCNLCLLGSGNPPVLASDYRQAPLPRLANFLYFFSLEMGFHHVFQAGLELLT